MGIKLVVGHVTSNEGGGYALLIGKKVARTYSRPERTFFLVVRLMLNQAELFFGDDWHRDGRQCLDGDEHWKNLSFTFGPFVLCDGFYNLEPVRTRRQRWFSNV